MSNQYEDETKSLWRCVSKLRKTSGGRNNLIKYSLCDFSFSEKELEVVQR